MAGEQIDVASWVAGCAVGLALGLSCLQVALYVEGGRDRVAASWSGTINDAHPQGYTATEETALGIGGGIGFLAGARIARAAKERRSPLGVTRS